MMCFLSGSDAPWTVLLANIEPEASSVMVGGLIPARSYQFRLCAVNDVGKGQFSRETARWVDEIPVMLWGAGNTQAFQTFYNSLLTCQESEGGKERSLCLIHTMHKTQENISPGKQRQVLNTTCDSIEFINTMVNHTVKTSRFIN